VRGDSFAFKGISSVIPLQSLGSTQFIFHKKQKAIGLKTKHTLRKKGVSCGVGF